MERPLPREFDAVIAAAFVRTNAHDWRPEEVRAAMLTPEDVARFVRFAVEQRPHSAIFEIDLDWSPV
jgi:NADP-dependent 3-hydroxy acid dehydrogenase YdfG